MNNIDPEVLDEDEMIPVIPNNAEIRKQEDELNTEVVGTKIEDMSREELVEHVESVNDETLAFLKAKAEDPNPEVAERAKLQYEIYGEILKLLAEVEVMIKEEKFDEAEGKTIEYLNSVAEKLAARGTQDVVIQNALKEIQDFVNIYGAMVEQTELGKGKGMELLSTGIDILPFVGGAKMMGEGAIGKTLTGKDLELKDRALYVAEGALWLTVDTVAVGAGAVSAGSGSVVVEGAAMALKVPKAAKLITRSAAVIRATKGAGKGSRAIFNAGRFLVEHPNLAKEADKLVARGVEARRAALLKAPGAAKDAYVENKKSVEIIQDVNRERQELLDTLGGIIEEKKAA
jgi:hypothetical protein